MKTVCRTYNLEQLERFADNEADPALQAQIALHLSSCEDCRLTVERCCRMNEFVSHTLSAKAGSIDTLGLEERVFEKALGSKGGGIKKVFDYFSSRLYLKIASLAAILIISLVVHLHGPGDIPGPSAIVTSVDGSMSSVMIFETQQSKHTVIWFSET
jgi:hypothetical protein